MNNIASILDLWEGHKTCRLIPAALEKKLIFQRKIALPLKIDYKVNMIVYFSDSAHSKFGIGFLKLLWKH